ncbi:MAG: hypothetical protein WC451_03205 [Patescibacteria group bacterium]|jgi:hypothetical protein
MNSQFGTNINEIRIKRVYYEGTSTIREGMPVCYNYDTTTNILGWSDSSSVKGSTTADGYQNEGKYLRVEDPSSTNYQWFAGVVHSSAYAGKAGPQWIDIALPTGAIIPIWAYAACTANVTVLGLSDGLAYFAQSTGDDDPIGCAIAMETVDRSSTAGLVLAKVFPTGQVIVGSNAYFLPSSYRNGRCYGFTVNGDAFFGGVAGAQEYLVHFVGSKSVVASGDCYGGILKIAGENEAAQPATYIFRSLNVACNNSGTLDKIESFLGVKNEGGATALEVIGLTMKIENFGTCTGAGTTLGGLDIIMDNEGTVAETEFGIRIRNENASVATEVASVFRIQETGVNTGFTYLVSVDELATISAYASTGDAPALATGDIMIPIRVTGTTTTYYLVAMQDAGV